MPAGDVGALASVLDRLLSDPAEADRLGARAAGLADRYDVASVAAVVRSVYADVMR